VGHPLEVIPAPPQGHRRRVTLFAPGQGDLHEVRVAQDPLIALPMCQAPSPAFLHLHPAAQAANQSSADEILPPALGRPLGHKGPVGLVCPPWPCPEGGEDIRDILPGPGPRPQHSAVTAVGVARQRGDVRDQPRTEGVQVDVAHQLLEVAVFLTDDRFVAVLEEIPVPAMAAVEPDRVAGEEAPHQGGQGDGTGPDQEVGMVRQEGPGIAGGLGGRQEPRQAGQKLLPILVVPEDIAALDPPDDDVLHGPRGVEAGGSRHGRLASTCWGCEASELFKGVPLCSHAGKGLGFNSGNLMLTRLPAVVPCADLDGFPTADEGGAHGGRRGYRD
jgi:hypothetical protein